MANKLELIWYGKEKQIKVEPRLLIENPELSNCKNEPKTGNMLIHGDNLLALKALEKDYQGKIKCIYIDPPYNTGAAFDEYDDNLEHSIWLQLMKARLECLRKLMREDGTIWISIDDDEGHYLKVLCDEIFGRNNFISTVVWQKIHSIKNDAKYLSENHDFILVYALNKEKVEFNLLPRTEEMNKRYKNPDNDPRGPWQSGDLVANEERTNGHYNVISPKTGKAFDVPEGKHWVYSEENMNKMIEDNQIWFGKTGNSFPRKKRFLKDVMQGRKGDTWWTSKEVGHNQESKRENINLFGKKHAFSTPKPERLIERILTLATKEDDYVLDSFLGSGTTIAVAHKMNRKYIGIEMGEQAYSLCKKRLDLVIEGNDDKGITESSKWEKGGAYRFYEVAPTLIEKDDFDEYIINPEYDANMLAASVALNEGFDYEPDEDVFWKQAKGNEDSYLYTTTRHITSDYLDSIKNMMEEDEFLIIACKSFDKNLANTYKNISLKKIPQLLLDKCEFGKDNYNLNIISPPVLDEFDEEEENE